MVREYIFFADTAIIIKPLTQTHLTTVPLFSDTESPAAYTKAPSHWYILVLDKEMQQQCFVRKAS